MTAIEHGVVVDRATVVRGPRRVIDGLSLHVAPGQAIALIGRDGSGTSSLLAAVATALPLHSGDIRVDGHSVRSSADATRMRVGYVPAGISAWPRARADEFLEVFSLQAGLRGKAMREAVARGLALAGITDPATAIDSLTAGRAARLLVARALLHDPPVLLADNPFATLDPAGRAELERLIEDMHLGGRIVVASIDDAIVPSCFTHVAVLDAGRLTAHGPMTPSAFHRDRGWRHRAVCPASAADAAAVLRRLAVDARAIDDDTVEYRHDPAVHAGGDLLASIMRAGITVESAGFDPPWTAQLVDDEP
ncbi:MAG: ATP-binding cassette domain-containing protein [Planctomycetia bacterium]